VREGLPGSWEDLFHRTGCARFLLPCAATAPGCQRLAPPRLQRAIGVIYRPQTERQSHYFHTRLDSQFDAMIHIDETTRWSRSDRGALWQGGEVPETFPSGM
jgi:erythromycin esterase-like protein